MQHRKYSDVDSIMMCHENKCSTLYSVLRVSCFRIIILRTGETIMIVRGYFIQIEYKQNQTDPTVRMYLALPRGHTTGSTLISRMRIHYNKLIVFRGEGVETNRRQLMVIITSWRVTYKFTNPLLFPGAGEMKIVFFAWHRILLLLLLGIPLDLLYHCPNAKHTCL